MLASAAQKAIECKCGDAAKMLADLQANKGDKSNGFWKLSTHPKQWNAVIESLRKEDVELLEPVLGHGH